MIYLLLNHLGGKIVSLNIVSGDINLGSSKWLY